MGYFPADLATFLGDRQHRRTLRLSFPHNDGPPATLLANWLDESEGLSRDFEFVVEVLSDNARIPLKQLMGRMVTGFSNIVHRTKP
jgi:type VI secretion system secreted protein VgrG